MGGSEVANAQRKEGIMESNRPINVHADVAGPIWFIGWLFTIGFAEITGWKILLALIVWPLYLGQAAG